MKKLSKVLSAVCALTLVLCLWGTTACSGGNDPGKDPGKDPEPEQATLEKIEVTKNPDKMVYVADELFDPSGMVVTATYSDRSTKAVTDYEWSPDGPLQRGDTEICISYQRKLAYLEGITVLDKEITGNVYRFESEEAEHISDGTDKQAYDCRYILAAAGASQGYTLDVRRAGQQAGTIDGKKGNYGLKWTFESSEEGTAKLYIRAGLRTKVDNNYWRAYKKTFSEMYTTYVNGELSHEDTMMFPNGSYDANSIRNYSPYQWQTIVFNIELKKGSNEIKFHVVGSTNAGPIDFIEITTPATLTDTTASTTHTLAEDAAEEWQVVKEPTPYEVGWLGKTCTTCKKVVAMVKLPKLNTTDYTVNVTKEASETANGIGTYVYNYEGQTITLENKVINALGEHHIHRFEGEDAAITDKNGTPLGCGTVLMAPTIGGNSTARPGLSHASAQTCLHEMHVAGNKVTYKINADKAVTAVFTLAVAKPVIAGVSEIELNKVWKATVNGAAIFEDTYMVPVGSSGDVSTAAANCDWICPVAEINLLQGVNEIVIEMQQDESAEEGIGFHGNFDYIEIDSTAKLTNLSEKTISHVDGWTTISAPTAEAGGKISNRYCTECGLALKTGSEVSGGEEIILDIPALDKTNYVYEQIVKEDGTKWGRYTYHVESGGSVTYEVLEQEEAHVCAHVCTVEGCGKCTDATCTDAVCADKCPGHDAT